MKGLHSSALLGYHMTKITGHMHYGVNFGSVADAEAFERGLEGFCKVEVFSR
jgi:hypothetical protein